MLAASRHRRRTVRTAGDTWETPPGWPILVTTVGVFLATLNFTKAKGP